MELLDTCPVPRFLKPDGGTVLLPVGVSDSLSYRIEALKVYLEQELSLDGFLGAISWSIMGALSWAGIYCKCFAQSDGAGSEKA